MRSNIFTGAVLAQICNVAAFPSAFQNLARDEIDDVYTADIIERQEFPIPNIGFNAAQQHVKNHGEHKFIAPGPDDQRGPCPGLNAMANHGYLPRNGIGSHVDFITGTFAAFGMAADLAGFLTVLGGSIDGNGLEWSIGGPSKYLPAPLGLGTPQGISGSHNKYETDASPMRGDLYMYGNDYSVIMSQWDLLYQMGQDNGDNYTLQVLNDFRSKRWDNSLTQNPYFFSGPFSGVLVAPAAFEFIYRFMSNKSEEYQQGYLNGAVLSSFFGMKKLPNGKFEHLVGQERIPDNWYKRAVGDEYGIPYLNSDTLLAGLKYPKFLSIGGNTGKVNTFKGVDPADISGGVYNSKNLLKGNNLACFSMSFAAQAAPDLLKCSNAFRDVTGVLGQLNSQLQKSIGGLDCAPLAKADVTQFKQFPGYSKLNCKTGLYK